MVANLRQVENCCWQVFGLMVVAPPPISTPPLYFTRERGEREWGWGRWQELKLVDIRSLGGAQLKGAQA